ncbi:acetyltransferase [Oligella urethralis]|uniref:acetyltransferase n=1 Tax=Oligella urethralis TaxID=90245 RepID=UPI000C9AB078|nr:acetyltransferase [Oligella urethralis]PMC15691.1 acetyltransferase [Oligella urethralis]
MKKTLLILGSGGHGKAVAEAALLSGDWDRALFVDDRWPEINEVFGCPVISDVSNIQNISEPIHGAIPAVGNNALREKWLNLITDTNIPVATVIHPRAYVSEKAQIGKGSAIMAQAVVGVDAKLGVGTIINANATVDHDAILGDFAHLGVGAQIAGGVLIGARAWLQAGCCAGYHVKVADDLVIPPGTALVAEQ